MPYVRKVLHCKIKKSAHPGSAPGFATGLSCHLKLIKYKRFQVSNHYFASYCQSPKPDFLQVLETPVEHEYFSAGQNIWKSGPK